ncbi:FG-GAP repeat domain-containing protein [Hyalangium minutum]|uniref:Putative aggregation factor core protein MAFp3, isoform C n=1 Tax=Hyalangium minutum TaxID=394096 RepID=A0A085W3T0_9BACT|nr:VCBS repeat-containing protein [Hyalangium minutum]KFE62343.1 putative aggregation factor core protein MAFp3, isoform C [Hyalangium minutum]
MSAVSKTSWAGAVVVVLFSIGCGGASESAGASGCMDNAAFDVSAILSATGEFPSAMACADFNGDGEMDLAVASPGSREVSVFLGQDGALASRVSFPVGGGSAVVARDFDADGWMDLSVTGAADGSVHLLKGYGPGGFAPAVLAEN